MRTLRFASWLGRFLLLSVLYALVRLLGALLGGPRRRALALLAVLGFGLAQLPIDSLRGCNRSAAPLRVATFNIRRFGVEATDLTRLQRLLRSANADVVAVQEIQDEALLGELLTRLGSDGGRRYEATLADCGGRSMMRVGVLYDPARVRLRAQHEYPELDPERAGSCDEGERAGLLGVFDDGRQSYHLLAVHLKHGSEQRNVARRREQWTRAHAIVRQLRAEGARHVMILGDVNSTGYLEPSSDERTFIHARARENGMEVTTDGLQCSEYWRPKPELLSPSLLDHVVATESLVRLDSVQVQGFCAELQCRPLEGSSAPEDYLRVSDHCPVVFELAR